MKTDIKGAAKTRPTRTKALPSAPQPKSARERVPLEVRIPREDFQVFTTCAEHFGLTPEMIMVYGVIDQLGAMEGTLLAVLASFDELPAAEDPVSVTLHFVPEGHALLLLVASLLRRPPAELAANLLHDDARFFSSDMKAAAETGGFDNHHELVDNVKRRMEAEFEARRGRMHREQDKDAWQWTYLDKYRPSRFPGSTAYQSLIRKGGEA